MKARKTTKKALSLILATVMVLMLIPASAFTAFASDAETVDDLWVEAENAYVINDLEDWNLIAADTTNTFEGKTVKLGADINIGKKVAKGLFKEFKGTFDGNSHKISGQMSGSTDDSAFIAVTLSGNAVIKNVVFDAAANNNTGNLAGIIAASVSSGSAVKVENVNFINGTVISRYVVGHRSGLVAAKVEGAIEIDDIVLNVAEVNTTHSGDNNRSLGILIGELFSDGDCSISNVVSTGSVTVSVRFQRGGVGGLIGNYQPTEDIDLTVSNVDIQHLVMNVRLYRTSAATTSTTNTLLNGVGGVIGTYVANGSSDVSISNVKLDGTLDIISTQYTTDNKPALGQIGGMIGLVTETNAKNIDAELDGDFEKYSGTIDIKNVESNLEITTEETIADSGTGGIIGSYGQKSGTTMNETAEKGFVLMKAPDAVLNIENVVIGGDVKANSAGGVGGVIGNATICSTTVNLNNVLIAGEVTNSKNNKAGVLLGYGVRLAWILNAFNCSTVTENDDIALGGDLGVDKGAGFNINEEEYQRISATITFNGKAYNAGNSDVSYTYQFTNSFNLQRSSIASVSAAEAAKMTERAKATGKVEGHLKGNYEQHTAVYENTAGEEVYDIRFITLSHADVTEGYKVTIRAKTLASDTDDDILFEDLECHAYTELIGYENGLEAYTSVSELGGKSFIAVLLTGIPAGVDYAFEVTASYVTADGITMTDEVRTLYVTWNEDTPTFSSTPVAA